MMRKRPQGAGPWGTPAPASACYRTSPPASHLPSPQTQSSSPGWGPGPLQPLDVAGRGLQVPLDLTPTKGAGRERGTKYGLGQSSEPHRLVCRRHCSCGPGHSAGGRGARGPPRVHPSSASPTGQLRMWTNYLYRPRWTGDGGTRSLVAICGHDPRCAGLPGGRAQSCVSVLGVLQPPKSPRAPVTGSGDSCPLTALLLKIPGSLPLHPTCPPALAHAHTCLWPRPSSLVPSPN